MDKTNDVVFQQKDVSSLSSPSDYSKNFIIGILVFVLVLSFLGINLLYLSGNVVDYLNKIFGPFISNILSLFGYTTGTLINTSAEVVGESAKFGIDVAQDSIQDVGNLFKSSSQNIDPKIKSALDSTINLGIRHPSEPDASTSQNPIQTSISSKKSTWCLVGEYKEKRGCIEVSDGDKCLSGQVFPSQRMCLNPTYTPNV
jgi:hypothetical protein